MNDTKGATGCELSGWVSGPSYSGPSMLVQLLVDGEAMGRPVVGSIHRMIAGDHGFVLPFDCAVAQSGNHSFTASARLNATAPVAFVVGEKCSTCMGPPPFCHKVAC